MFPKPHSYENGVRFHHQEMYLGPCQTSTIDMLCDIDID